MAGNFDRKLRLPRTHFRVLLHAANMRHGTNSFTFLPKEGVLRIFFALKNPTILASTLPLDNRSCFCDTIWNVTSLLGVNVKAPSNRVLLQTHPLRNEGSAHVHISSHESICRTHNGYVTERYNNTSQRIFQSMKVNYEGRTESHEQQFFVK